MPPDSTTARVPLWRAFHVELDPPPPHVLADEIGLQLAAPDAVWQRRRDTNPRWTSRRASIVARTRFVEDLVAERVDAGITQYVVLGALRDSM